MKWGCAGVVVAVLGSFGVSVATAKQFAYVPNQGSNNVSVIDVDSDVVVTNLRAGISPVRVAVRPDGKKVYVANIGSDRVTVINATTNSVGRFIIVGDSPAEILVSPDGSQVYTPNAQSQNVTIINTATESVITNLPASFNCRAILWVTNSIGNRVYVANQGAGTVTVIDPQTLTVDRTIPVGGGPRRLAVSPDGNRVYVANYQSDDVSIIDAVTRTRLMNLPVGNGPRGVSVTPNGAEVWVTNLLSNNVSVISTASNTILTNLPAGILPWTVVFNHDGTRAYILNSGNYNVSVFDVTTRALLKTIPVGNGCFWAEFNSDGTKLYVTNPPEGSVSVIDTVRGINIGTIFTGESAWVIALTPDESPAITSVFPTNIQAGTTIQMDVLGSAFRLGATPALLPANPEATFTNISLLSSNEIAFTVTLTTNSALGPFSLQIKNIDGTTATLTNAITILPPPPAPPPPPVITSIVPGQITAGSTVSMVVNGSDFEPGATVIVPGGTATFNVAGTVTLNSNQISFDLTAAANAAVGFHDLTVANPDGQSRTNSSAFEVLPAPAPTISAVDPGQVTNGTTVAFSLAGTGFLPGIAVAPAPANAGITIDGVDYLSTTSLTVYATYAANATTGVQGFSVTNLDNQTAANTSLYTVLPAPPPVIDYVAPTELPAGANYQVEIGGHGFLAGVTVTPIPANTGVTVTSLQSVGPSAILANITVDANATRGLYGLAVANLDAQSATTQQVLNVTGAALPVVNSVTPTSFVAGNTVAMTISGANFQTGASVAITPSNAGATISNVQVIDPGTITLTLSTTLSAASGSFGFIVTNPDATSTSAGNLFTIMPAPALSIATVTPSSIGRNGTTALALTGSSFQPSTTVTILKAGQGVSLAGVTYLNTSNMIVNVAVTANASIGFRDLRVANPGAMFIKTNAFNVLSTAVPPVVGAVSPNQVTAGTSTSMLLQGDKFQSGATVSIVGSPAGLTVSSVSVLSSNQISFALNAAVNAPLGVQGIRVQNPDGQSGTNATAFTVLAAPAPTLTGASPTNVLAGTSATMTLSGTGFQAGITVAAFPANAGMTINSVTLNSSTSLSVNVSFGTNATAGAQGFTVMNLDGQSASAGNLFTIQSVPLPEVTGATPTSVTAGETVAMTVTGAHFQPGATIALTPGNAGATISNVQVVDANTITLTLTTTLSASPGSFGFTVTNPDTLSGAGNGLFTILAAPPLSVTGVAPQVISRNATTTLTLTGTSFQPSTTVTILKAGAGVTLAGKTFVNTTTMTIDVSVTATASLGWRDLRLANGASTVTVTNAFRVQ